MSYKSTDQIPSIKTSLLIFFWRKSEDKEMSRGIIDKRETTVTSFQLQAPDWVKSHLSPPKEGFKEDGVREFPEKQWEDKAAVTDAGRGN